MTYWSPKDLAEAIGLPENGNIRQPLRERYPDRQKHTRWELGREDIELVCRWNVERGRISEKELTRVLEEFDAEQELDAELGAGPVKGDPPEFGVIDYEGPVRREGQRLLEIARNGGSVLTDHDVWTDENIEILVERFVKQPDVSGASFFTKLDTQLANVEDDVRVLFAELFLLQMLPIAQFRTSTKVGNIKRVLRDTNGEYEIPGEILESFESPVFGGGVAFAIRRFQQLSTLIEVVRYLRTLSTEELDEAAEDPLAWREVIMSAPGTPEPSLRAALTYLGHPEYFFPIVSPTHKRYIVEAFFPDVTKRAASGDYDVDLAALREWFSPEPGTTPDFYNDPLASYWLEYEDGGQEEESSDPDLVGEQRPYSVESIIADGAFHSVAELRQIVNRWDETKNIVLQGPPGTGKTWLARRLAYALIGFEDEAAVRAVQFHAGTSYEDFVRGWRPGGDGKLTLVDGPLLQHAELARKREDIPHVLIIEEFNRGNPAQALGEMLTLLESTKRNERDALELTYKREDEGRFSLPENLHIIGTMNTADRSLALVDFALRRRFAFFELEPQLNTVWKAYLSGRFRKEPAAHIDVIGQRVTAMNDRIAGDPSLGKSFLIGHSYLTPEKEVSELEPWFRAVVETAIAPQLREYWHDQPEVVDRIVEQLLAEL